MPTPTKPWVPCAEREEDGVTPVPEKADTPEKKTVNVPEKGTPPAGGEVCSLCGHRQAMTEAQKKRAQRARKKDDP